MSQFTQAWAAHPGWVVAMFAAAGFSFGLVWVAVCDYLLTKKRRRELENKEQELDAKYKAATELNMQVLDLLEKLKHKQ